MKLTCIKGNQSIPLLYFSWYMCYAIFDLYKKPTPLHIIREFSPNENSSCKFLYEAKKISWNLTREQFIRLNLMAFRMPWKNNMLEILEFYTILSCVHARIFFWSSLSYAFIKNSSKTIIFASFNSVFWFSTILNKPLIAINHKKTKNYFILSFNIDQKNLITMKKTIWYFIIQKIIRNFWLEPK